jgi:hypothetical protein
MNNRFLFETASEKDNQELLKRLEKDYMEGDIQVVFKRQPNYFYSLQATSKFQQVLTLRDRQANKIIGIGSRVIKPVYINGNPSTIGYLSDLRLDLKYRNGLLLARGYRYLEKLHQDQKTKLYLTTIIKDNTRAAKMLANNRKGLPQYHDIGLYYSWLISIGSPRKCRSNKKITIVRGDAINLKDILRYVSNTGRNKQFYPIYAESDYLQGNGFLRDFTVNDFYIAIEDDKIIGVMAKWDQRKFKQIYVNKYKGWLKYGRYIINACAKLQGYAGFPPLRTEINYFPICMVAVEDNNPELFYEMLSYIYNDNIGKGYDYFLVGLHSTDPLCAAMKKFSAICISSRSYVASWEDGLDDISKIDKRVPYLEVASL